MTLWNITPSSGRVRPTSINLNRLKLRPGDRVVYWSAIATTAKIGEIDAYATRDGNHFVIAGETVFVTVIWARMPESCTVEQEEAIAGAFAAIGRPTISWAERIRLCNLHGLAS